MAHSRPHLEHRTGLLTWATPGSSVLLALLILVALPAVGAGAVPAAAMVLEVALRETPRRDHASRDHTSDHQYVSSTLRVDAAPLTSGQAFEAVARPAGPATPSATRSTSLARPSPRAGLLDLPPPARS